MENQNMNTNTAAFRSLSETELRDINGGDGFFETLGYVLGMTARCFYEFGKAGGEYQASLPPKHKK
ncbi:MAG: hypothetical protein EOO02_14260 [Chitinophagaceae bacterium]|nr:MAG: hypothetical protein EOO02_14260 [Chitinophagaceae bacterium]